MNLTLYAVHSPRLGRLLAHPATLIKGDGIPVLYASQGAAEQASACLNEPGPVVAITLEWTLIGEPIIEAPPAPEVPEAEETPIAEPVPRRTGRLGLSANKKSAPKPISKRA